MNSEFHIANKFSRLIGPFIAGGNAKNTDGIAPYLAVIVLLTFAPIARAEPTQICRYDPTLGVPNPLGMRNYLTITEEDGDTTFEFEQFPAEIGRDEISVTFAAIHRMTFYETGVEEARSLMLQNPYYYYNLTGYQDPGFDLVNAVLTCSPPDTELKEFSFKQS